MTASRPGWWKGTPPARSASTFSAEMSRTTTSWPRSAKPAPVTRPAYPAPKTAIRSAMATQRLQAARDGEHRLVRELVVQRVHDPVRTVASPQHDHVQVRAREIQVVVAALDA